MSGINTDKKVWVLFGNMFVYFVINHKQGLGFSSSFIIKGLWYWFALEKWLNGPRQQPGRVQLRHNESRTARRRENPHKGKNTIKIIYLNNM